MEMPFDVLNIRLGKIRDNGDIDFDNTAAALDIDMDLQSKFLFFPIEELEAVEIEEVRDRLHAGSGPEHCNAGENENPQWLYNHAVNALALYWRIKNDQEDREKLAKEEHEAEERRIAVSRRPEPGIYSLNTKGPTDYLVVVTADRRILDLKAGVRERHADFTDVYDGLTNKSQWTFTLVETGLSA